MQRRNFLQNLVASASTLSVASVPYGVAHLLAPAIAAEPSRHIRPPGALKDESSFVDACIGCGICGEICPPKCILFDKSIGGKKVNLPYIDPPDKACTLCMKCVEVCPTEALTEVKREEVDMGLAQIDRTACYPWVDRGVCGACVAVCPLGRKAIVFEFADMYRPIVQEDGCVGCGLCVEVCPQPSLPIKIVERSKGSVAAHNV
ncbi:MAG: 4Fe-4S dicluster domain-containing protein [Gammaproteobacteria bacterium]|nr:4Fe-4S dicluster domain-containing protein [Gammaproteobacteria bacterium]